jgi:hypothetical protein
MERRFNHETAGLNMINIRGWRKNYAIDGSRGGDPLVAGARKGAIIVRRKT